MRLNADLLQYLAAIAGDCQKAGTEFLSYLDAFISQSTSSNRLKSARASIKFQFAHGKIENFASIIDKLRSSLTLASILAFRANSDNNIEEIPSHLKLLEEGQSTGKRELQDSLRLLADAVQSQTGPKLDTVTARINQCLQEIDGLRQKLPLTRERDILSWLSFRQMLWRYEEIPEAH